MTDLLIRVMRLPYQTQRMIAFLLVALLVILALLIVATLTRSLSDRVASIGALRHQLAQKEAMVSAANKLHKSTRVQTDSDIYFHGSGKPAIQAAMQAAVSSLVSENDATLQSTAAIESPNAQAVSISLTMTGSNSSIIRTLSAMESSKPILLIRNVTLSASDAKIDRVLAQVTIDGFVLDEAKP